MRVSSTHEQLLTEAAVSASASSTMDAGVIARDKTAGWARASRQCGVAAEHGNTRTVLGTAEGNHVLADVGSDEFTVLRAAVGEDVLDQVIAELIPSNYSRYYIVHRQIKSFTYYRSMACVDGPGGLHKPSPGSGPGSHCRQS